MARPPAVRAAAAVASVALAVGVPASLVLLAVAGPRWRGFAGALLALSIAVPIAAWFLWGPPRAGDRRPDDLVD